LIPPAVIKRSFWPAAAISSLLTLIIPSVKAAPKPAIELNVDLINHQYEQLPSVDSTGVIITGHINDGSDCSSLMGATIKLSGTTLHTVTDTSGNFELFIPADHVQQEFTLLACFVGFKTQEIITLKKPQGTYLPVELTMEANVKGSFETVSSKQGLGQRIKRIFH
jgi:hypothetical protein